MKLPTHLRLQKANVRARFLGINIKMPVFYLGPDATPNAAMAQARTREERGILMTRAMIDMANEQSQKPLILGAWAPRIEERFDEQLRLERQARRKRLIRWPFGRHSE